MKTSVIDMLRHAFGPTHAKLALWEFTSFPFSDLDRVEREAREIIERARSPEFGGSIDRLFRVLLREREAHYDRELARLRAARELEK